MHCHGQPPTRALINPLLLAASGHLFANSSGLRADGRSEDLDFSIAMILGATRGDRRKAMEPAKRQLSSIQKVVPALKIVSELAGHNEGRQ